MKQLKDEALGMIAHRLKMLSEPMRLKILHTLQDGEKSVHELVELTGAGQANVSKHLSLLASHHIVGRRREGLNVYYYITDDSIFKICDLVCRNMEKDMKRYSDVFG
jgi:DNA-binding transcriptional ArsR family regulator